MKNLSIVIVSYNTKDLLRRSIDSVLSQMDATNDELIVVDNCSTDGTAAMVKADYPRVTLLALDKDYGYAYGSNRGFEKSSGQYILVTSSDIVFPAGTLTPLVEKMKAQPRVGVVCPELIDFDGTLHQLTWQWRVGIFNELLNKLFSPISIARYGMVRRLVPFLQRKEKAVAWVSGAVFLVSRGAMAKVGGFDENFQLYYEDTDLFERIRSSGYTILFTPEIKVFHGLGQSTKNEQSKVYLIFVQSRLYYYQKHLSWIQCWLLKKWLNWKLKSSLAYKSRERYRYWVDTILNQQGTVPLWQDIQL